MAPENSQQDAVTHFCDLTGATASEARTYLTTYEWQMDQALQAYYEDEEDETPGARSVPPPGESDETEIYTGPRTLDGRPAPYLMDGSQHSQPRQQPRGNSSRLRTLGDLTSQEEDDGHEADDGRSRGDLFAGGEKSGLAVQDPNQDPRSLIRDIMEKARRNAQQGGPSSSAGPSQPSRFSGAGQTLGGDGVPSRTIPDPRGAPIPRVGGQQRPSQPPVERTLHMWEDGFSIDDGPLHRHDDPRNTEALRLINTGRVPMHLMNINYDEQVDVKLVKHDENWRQLPRIYRPFSGEGRRLGSPVPGEATTSISEAVAPTTQSPAASAGAPPAPTGLDESQPTIMIRIQLPNGTRLPARFNTTQTIADVYEFVQQSNPETRSRNWVLATTFPNKEHIDRGTVLGEMAEFKRGGTAVVKWI